MAPVMGRGFSLGSYAIVSTCLTFQEKTEPSYNYVYDMHEVDDTGTISSSTGGSVSASMGYGFIKSSVSASFSTSKDSNFRTRSIITTMKMERFYSSMDDSSAEFTSGAKELLVNGDTVGFFQACGSSYIRTIRRSAEIVAIFTLKASSEKSLTESAASLSASLNYFGLSAGVSASAHHSSESTSSKTETSISIRAYGLGLHMDGAETLVARDIDDYFKAVNYAFKSMQNQDVGIVQGIEVVNWVNCLQFQNLVKFREGIEQLIVVKLKQQDLLTEERLENAKAADKKRMDEVKQVTDSSKEEMSKLDVEYSSAKLLVKDAKSNTEVAKQEADKARKDYADAKKAEEEEKHKYEKAKKDLIAAGKSRGDFKIKKENLEKDNNLLLKDFESFAISEGITLPSTNPLDNIAIDAFRVAISGKDGAEDILQKLHEYENNLRAIKVTEGKIKENNDIIKGFLTTDTSPEPPVPLDFDFDGRCAPGADQICLTKTSYEAAHTDTGTKEVTKKDKEDILSKAQKKQNEAVLAVSLVEEKRNAVSEKLRNDIQEKSVVNVNIAGLSADEVRHGDVQLAMSDSIESIDTRYTYKGIATGIPLSSMALKSIALINSEFIAYFEDKYKSQVGNVLNGLQCQSMLEFYQSQDLGERKIENRKRMKLNLKELQDNSRSTSVTSLKNYLSREKLTSKMSQIKIIMSEFYAPCISAMMASASGGVFTRYYFELEACDLNKYDKIVTEKAPEGSSELNLDFDSIIEAYCLPELLPV